VAINAQDVKLLREKTGAGLMDCKQALSESGGDFDKAIKLLREKGLAEAKTRSGREAKEGLITVLWGKNDDEVVMVEVNCETDFVSRTEKYRDFVRQIAGAILADGTEKLEKVSEKVQTLVKEAIAAFGENIILRRLARLKKDDPQRSVLQSYIHLDGRAGVIAELHADPDTVKKNEAFVEFAKNITLQIASMGPFSVSKEDFPKKILEEQKEIFAKQALESGKPANIVDKIAAGKMEKFFAENTLLEQKYVKDNNLTVKQYLAETEKKAGGKIAVKRFARFKLGEEQ
jgi:elongation factor Ts